MDDGQLANTTTTLQIILKHFNLFELLTRSGCRLFPLTGHKHTRLDTASRTWTILGKGLAVKMK